MDSSRPSPQVLHQDLPKLSLPALFGLLVIAGLLITVSVLHHQHTALDLNSQGIQYSASYQASSADIDATDIYQSPNWIQLENTKLAHSLGYSQKSLWLKLHLSNTQAKSREFILHLNNNLIDSIELFYFDHAGQFINKRDYGDTLPFHTREIPIKSYAIPIALDAKQERIYLIRLSGKSALSFNLSFLDTRSIADLIISEYLTLGFLFGALALMAAFNYLLFIVSKLRVYLHFSLFIISTSICLAHISGAGFSFLWPDKPIINALLLPASVSSMIFFGSIFLQSILGSYHSPILDKLFLLTKLFAITPLAALFVFELQAGYILSLIFFSFGIVASAGISVSELYKGNTIAAYILVSLSIYIAAITLYCLSLSGFIMVNNANTLFYSAAIFQISVLSGATLYYMNVKLFKSKSCLENQIHSLDVKQSALEKELKINQTALDETYESLQKNYSEFNQLSQIDALTKLKNRLYFQDFIDHAYLHAKQHQYPISLIFCDLDWFNDLNNKHHPLLGDKFLVSCAVAIQQQCEVFNNYCCARFSGQEFVIVLPHCDTQQALESSELIRQAIATITHIWHNQRISITASFGIACHGPDLYTSASQLIESADQAMASAKQNGRNQVQLG